jgi:calcium-dependent protein kinase
VVYKARERASNGEFRAVKKIAKRNIKNPELFLNEIDIHRGVDHPSCVKLYETFEDSRSVFLVTEYCFTRFSICEGGELF